MQKSGLIVEDEALIAMRLQQLLEASGWSVMGPVATVQGALRLLETGLPTVALLDVNLGNERVTPVAEKLRSLSVPFAVASAYEQPDRFGGDVLIGAPNVGKPTDDSLVLETLASLTDPE